MFPKTEGAPPLILASASRTRAAMFEAVGIDVSLQPAGVDEDEIKASFKAAGGSAGEAAIALAELKANVTAAAVPPEAIVLGADQILTCEGDWFDKPPDRAAAHTQLSKLAGKPHELHTAVVALRGGVRIWHHLAVPCLQMRPLSDGIIESYLDAAGNEVLASVGCYRIEGEGAHLFTSIDGDYFSILGMPLLPVLAFLREQGVVMT